MAFSSVMIEELEEMKCLFIPIHEYETPSCSTLDIDSYMSALINVDWSGGDREQ